MDTINPNPNPRLKDLDTKALSELFYSDNFLMRNYRTLFDKVKEEKLPYTRAQVKEWYDNQAVVQIFRPLSKQNYMPILKYAVGERVYIDTMFFDDYAVVCIIDLFSKFAHAKTFKKPITSAKALQAYNEFASLLKHDVKEVRSDVGSEFNKDFKKALEQKQTRTLPYAKNEASPIERFNGTLRRIVERLFVVRGKTIDATPKYVKLAVKAYNNTVHSATSQTPNSVISSPEVAQEAVKRLKRTLGQKALKASSPNMRVDDKVRVWIRDITNPFDRKIAPNWSFDLYTIKQIDKPRNRIKLDDDQWYKPIYLQKVDEKKLNAPKKYMKVLTKALDEQKEEQRKERRKAREMKNLADYNRAPEATSS